jgi:hypothetical protein
MNTCASCTRQLPPEAFVCKGKVFKTCSSCLSKKKGKRANRTTPPENSESGSKSETSFETIDFYEVSDYIADRVSGCAKLAVDLNIKFDDETLTSISPNVKLLVKAVVDVIEDGDGYSWV